MWNIKRIFNPQQCEKCAKLEEEVKDLRLRLARVWKGGEGEDNLAALLGMNLEEYEKWAENNKFSMQQKTFPQEPK